MVDYYTDAYEYVDMSIFVYSYVPGLSTCQLSSAGDIYHIIIYTCDHMCMQTCHDMPGFCVHFSDQNHDHVDSTHMSNVKGSPEREEYFGRHGIDAIYPLTVCPWKLPSSLLIHHDSSIKHADLP